LPKRRLDPPASEPVVAKQQRDTSAKPFATDKLSDIKQTLSTKIKETLQKKSFASLLKEAPLQTESGDEEISAQSSFAPLQMENGGEEISAQSSFAPLQTESGDEEISAHSSFAVLGEGGSMHSLQFGVDSEQVNRSYLERSLSQVSDFSPSFLDTTPRSAGSSFNGTLQPLEAPDPIRDYWRNFANVKTRGSFDSVSIVNEKDRVVAHSSRVGRPHEHLPEHARIEEYDCEAHARESEDRIERMALVSKRAEIREPEQGRSTNRSTYLRAAAPVRHDVEEELPKQVADRLLYVMSPLLSDDTDLDNESIDLQTHNTDLETAYSAESDAAEKAQLCSFLCGGLELGFKGFPGCS
jgi:hypothetical protein